MLAPPRGRVGQKAKGGDGTRREVGEEGRRGIRLKSLSDDEPGVQQLIGTASAPHPLSGQHSGKGHHPEALRALREYLEETLRGLDHDD